MCLENSTARPYLTGILSEMLASLVKIVAWYLPGYGAVILDALLAKLRRYIFHPPATELKPNELDQVAGTRCSHSLRIHSLP